MNIRKPTDEEKEMATSWPVWEKEPSAFDWSYDSPETCLIISGRAEISHTGGKSEIAAGDWVEFPAGMNCTWKITEKIKKHYKFG